MNAKRVFGLLLLATGLGAAADFSYVEKSEMTGGALKRMMGFAARFAKGVNAPISTTHAYSDSKKAAVTDKTREIWDLGAETITHVNLEGKEYSTITFAEMAELATAMAAQMSQMANQGKTETVDGTAKWKASFEKTGQTKQVAGVTANGGTMKMELEGTDAKTGQTGVMKMDIDMFMGMLPGWEVKKAFDQRMGEKLLAQSGPQMMAMAQAGAAGMEAMKEAGRKIAELGEMQLASVMKMYSNNIPGMPEGGDANAPAPAGPSASDIAKEEAGRQAGNEVGRRAGGRFGGLGGRLGGKLGEMARKKEEPAPAAAPAKEAAPAAPAGPGVLMEMTTEVVSYSASVDASLFAVPAGFKQVEHPMKKTWGKYTKQ